MSTCPSCARDIKTNANGDLRAHRYDGIPCPAGKTSTHIALPWTMPLTQNQVRRMHPLAEAREKKRLKTEARWAIRAAKIKPRVGADVTLHWRVPDARRRDGDGAAPSLKVCLDALVDEGVIPDDSWVHVPKATIHIHPPQPGMPAGMWLQLDDPDQEEM